MRNCKHGRGITDSPLISEMPAVHQLLAALKESLQGQSQRSASDLASPYELLLDFDSLPCATESETPIHHMWAAQLLRLRKLGRDKEADNLIELHNALQG